MELSKLHKKTETGQRSISEVGGRLQSIEVGEDRLAGVVEGGGIRFRDNRQNSLVLKKTSHSKSWNRYKMLYFLISPYSNIYLQIKGQICIEGETPSVLVVSPVPRTREISMVGHLPSHKEEANIQ